MEKLQWKKLRYKSILWVKYLKLSAYKVLNVIEILSLISGSFSTSLTEDNLLNTDLQT